MKRHPIFIPSIVFVGTLPFVFCHPTRPASEALLARIDERIELTSIVSRPIGYKEYCSEDNRSYATKIKITLGPTKRIR